MSKWYTNPEGILVQKEGLKPKVKSKPIKSKANFAFPDVPRPFHKDYDPYYCIYEVDEENNSISIKDDSNILTTERLVNIFNDFWVNEYGENLSSSDLEEIKEDNKLKIQIPSKIEDKKKALKFLTGAIDYLNNEAYVDVRFEIKDEEDKIYISNGKQSPLFVEYLIVHELLKNKKFKSIDYEIDYKDDKMIIDYTKDKTKKSRNGEYSYFAFKNAIKKVQKKHNTGNDVPQTEYDHPFSSDSESDDDDPLGDMMDRYLTTCHARR